MAGGLEWLQNIFLFTFLFGLVFTVASLLLGVVDVGFNLGHDGQFDLGGHHADHMDGSGGDGPSLFNLPTLMAFFTWFG